MKRETGKVFLACAIGACLGSLVALEMTRAFWWIGLLVGGFGGYLAYDFRGAIRAVPSTARAAYGGGSTTLNWLVANIRSARNWFAASEHPFFFIGALLAAGWFKPVWYFHSQILDTGPPSSLGSFIMALISWLMWSGALGFISLGPVSLMLWIGAKFGEQKFWLTPRLDNERAYNTPKYKTRREELEGEGLKPAPLTYGNVLRWFAKSIALVITLFVWTIPVAILGGIVWTIKFFGRFAWQLFLRIHSEMRLLCGVDAMLGAAVGYFAGSAIIGALAGGMFGVLNYAVVTERWLKRYGYLPVR